MELQELLNNLDSNQKKINDSYPLSTEEVKELDEYFRIGNTYSSNALEGNSLTLTETKVLLEDGITVAGKLIKDVYEATGHAKAYDYMLFIARSGQLDITEDTIKKLHYLFYNAIDDEKAGFYRDHQVFISGMDYLPPLPQDVPGLMKEFLTELNSKVENLHPVLLAAFAHRRLVDIHPFTDGNGRMARLLMNLYMTRMGAGKKNMITQLDISVCFDVELSDERHFAR